MHSKLLLAAFAGLSATALTLSALPAAAADDSVKAVAIVKNANGKFVFTDTNIQITEGQTIKWVAVDSDVPHQLVADTEGDAMTDTGTFDSTAPISQTFTKAGTINYHCAIHPKSMRGTITVAAAEPPAEAVEAPAEKPAPAQVEQRTEPKPRKAKRSNGYGSGYGYGYGY